MFSSSAVTYRLSPPPPVLLDLCRVMVAPHRMKRPWNGAQEPPFDFASIPQHDPSNPLSPGVGYTASSGSVTFQHWIPCCPGAKCGVYAT